MMQPAPLPDRQDAILNAAFQAFSTYGFRRTSMDDIAKAVGMSRTALYLHYRNKEDIFRSLAQRHFDQTIVDMQAALDADGQTLRQALYGCFLAIDGKFMEVVLSSPHGSELMDVGFAVSGDVAAAAEARMTEILAQWLKDNGLPTDLGPALDFAKTTFAALKGLKSSVKTIEALRANEDRLAGLIAKALTARA